MIFGLRSGSWARIWRLLDCFSSLSLTESSSTRSQWKLEMHLEAGEQQTVFDRNQLGLCYVSEKRSFECTISQLVAAVFVIVSDRPFHHHINGQLSISHAKSISALFAFSSQAWRFCVLIRLSNHPYISPSFHFDPIVYYRRALGGKKLTLTHAEDEDIMRDAYDDVVLLCARNRRSKCASRKW